jgi:hypothetical protein
MQGASQTSKPTGTVYDTGPLKGKPVDGLLQQGNIDVNHRPGITNDDGTHSSIFSITVPINKDGSSWKGKYEDAPQYALVPSIANGKFLTPNGKIPLNADLPEDEVRKLSPSQQETRQEQLGKLEDAATKYYDKTREHLGIFSSKDAANKYAEATHAYMNDGTDRKVYTPSY